MSNLKEFDVILDVEGQVATLEALETALSSGLGLALGVLSGGVLRDLTLDGKASREDQFLSVESLSPNHPLRRVGRLEALRARYAETTAKYEGRQRELDEEAQRERKLASAEIETLLKASDERVKLYFAARQAKLLSWLDQELSAAHVDPLGELDLDLAALIDPKRLAEVDSALKELSKTLASQADTQLELTFDKQHADGAKRARRLISNMMGQQADALRQRVHEPYADLKRELEEHRERLGRVHAERVISINKSVAEIRVQVRERIECAFERSAELFHNRMKERLRRMDLPRPGEVEASLADISGQVESWSQSFITRGQSELRLFAWALSERPDGLGKQLQDKFKRCEASLKQLQLSTASILRTQLESPLVIDGTWQSSTAVNGLSNALRSQFSAARLDSQRSMGKASSLLIANLREERELTDQAWQDMRKQLARLLQEAGNDCWELKGPYLDGRFPTKPAEVSMLR